MKKIIVKIKGYLAYFIMLICSIFPIQNKIVFTSFRGLCYNDNPKAIFKELKKANHRIKFIWLMKNDNEIIDGSKIIKYRSLRAIYHLATARVWIDNKRKSRWIHKRKEQYYIQTWHGDIALKKIERDAEEKLDKDYIVTAKRDSENIDLFISGTKWMTKKLSSTFWYDGKILEVGMPRYDLFYLNENEKLNNKEKIMKSLSIEKNVKIILYAPTFRNNKRVDIYTLNYNQLLNMCRNKWGEEWKIFIRLHPNIQDMHKKIKYNDNVIDMSTYPDINELINICDILITDYSSCMFDAMIARKKCFLYAIDIKDYYDERGFYWKFDELPFSLATNNEDLLNNILNYNENIYIQKVESFENKVGLISNSNASKDVVDYIINNFM